MTIKGIPREKIMADIKKRVEDLDASSRFDYTNDTHADTCSFCGAKDDYVRTTGHCILHTEKHDWFKTDDGVRIWDYARVKEFWRTIREEKIAKNDYDFTHVIFPKFADENFWLSGASRVFRHDVSFVQASFLDHALFFETVFAGRVMFHGCTVDGTADFRFAICKQQSDFGTIRFAGKLLFMNVTCEESCAFRNNKMFDETDFSNTTFRKSVEWNGSRFLGKADFSLIKSMGKADFSDVQFTHAAIFWLSRFEKADFSRVTFSSEQRTQFLQATFGKGADFSHIVFPGTTVFRRTDLRYASFKDSKIDKALFSECTFNESLGRTALFDEVMLLKKRHNKPFAPEQTIKFLDKIRSRNISSEDFEEVEELDRQMKKNFEERRDYENAGDFHYGEMEMRRRKLRAEVFEVNTEEEPIARAVAHAFNWVTVYPGRRFLLFWYGVLAGYGERAEHTWLAIIAALGVFTGLFWWTFGFHPNELLTALSMAGENFIPLLSSLDAEHTNIMRRMIYDAETIVSTILWFLLLISVRRTFQ
ncbi:MAG: pentapeptide repeat-containing protein [Candidatus Yonathbacteria bacterium]|nr:pentapeptide repeat-containing protein [Candidatus Yonathbacteria bacterium]NTW47928.1 pentapeptide repeat-containing protein [Candidatus Yonathbacteria bacterium]